jgi:hypothetical protein
MDYDPADAPVVIWKVFGHTPRPFYVELILRTYWHCNRCGRMLGEQKFSCSGRLT